MLVHYVAATGVLALLTLAPGPDMAVVMRRALVTRTDGIRAAVGVACGLLVWGSLAVLGLGAILAKLPEAYRALQVVGVGYLVFLGVQSLRGGESPETASRSTSAQRRPFVTGLATNLLNPKIAVFYAALLPTLASPNSGAWGLGLLVLTHVGLTLAWLGGVTYALDKARALIRRPRVRRSLERVTGVVLIGFAVRLAIQRP